MTRRRQLVACRARRTSLLLLACVTAALALLGCKRAGTTDADAGRSHGRLLTRPGLNVLLISIDTARADHFACYGHPEIKTPNVDRLAAEGTLFTQCSAPVPVTLPSHTSMMTGTYPYVHGVRDNGQFYVHADNLTLAEALRGAGYATAAQVAAYVLNREFGLDQGFDTYDDVVASRRSLTPGGKQPSNERKAEQVCAAASAWLRENGDKTFFLFVHFFDPHHSYTPPPRFAAQYENPYLGEIAYVDEQIGRLLDVLDALDLTGKTLLVLTADHGEGLGDHDEETHGLFLYESTVAVPLIFRCPGSIPENRRVAGLVRLIDIAPTILDVLGLPALPDAQGTSLLPLISGRAADLKLAAYSETFYPTFSMGYAWSRSWRLGDWKYIHARLPELYHLGDDPLEEKNLAAAQPERVARMRAELRKLLAEARPIVGAARRTLTQKDRRALESLGYVSSGTGPQEFESELDLFEPRGPEPEDFSEQSRLMARAVELMFARRFTRAEQILRDLLTQTSHEQAFWSVHKTLAEVLSYQNKLDEALEHYRKALAIRPDDGETRASLANVLASLGRLDEAIPAYQQALSDPPVFATTHHGYGQALALKNRVHEALAQQRAALRLDPDFAAAHAEVGRLLAGMGRPQEATEAYLRALELAPRDAQTRGRFAEFLLAQNRTAEALRQFQQLVRLTPQSPRAFGGLGMAYNALGRTDQAVKSLRQAVTLDPRLPQAWQALGQILVDQHRYAEAIAALRSGHEAAPQHPGLANALASLLATCPDDALRDGGEALRLARRLERTTAGRDPLVLDTLAAALAEQGRFAEAVNVVDRALALASGSGESALVEQLRERRRLYSANSPFRRPAGP